MHFVHCNDYPFFFFFPPDFLLPEDLDADDFLEPPPAFFAEEDLPPFLDFWTWAGPPPPPPPPPEETGVTAMEGGLGANEENGSLETFFNIPLEVAPYDVVPLESIVSLSVNE